MIYFIQGTLIYPIKDLLLNIPRTEIQKNIDK